MCYNVQNKASFQALIERFNAKFNLPQLYQPHQEINAFAGIHLPILTNEASRVFQFGHWGLLPNWAKDISFDKNTKNARLETIGEKPSFRGYKEQRCLIPATAFYEWKRHDSKGKKKEKFIISPKNISIFTFAGLYNRWKDPNSGKELLSFTIVTKSAEGIMQEIHNTKQRMPVILKMNSENAWLSNGKIDYVSDFIAVSQTPMNLKFNF
jgi:putative SOS response-associated peptidase YedK